MQVYTLVFALRCALRKVREPSQDDVLAHAGLTRCASAFRVNRVSGGSGWRRAFHTTTDAMLNTTTALTAAGETYFADLGRVRASGGATGERSSYGPLANLLNAVGATLAPKVFCVGELADQGAGHPDFGLYAAKQVQQGRPREGQVPERGVVEVKAAGDDAWLTAAGGQVSRYWGRYRLVLVTNTRDFVLVGEDAAGRPTKLETFRLADDADTFVRRLETPRAFANISPGRCRTARRWPSRRTWRGCSRRMRVTGSRGSRRRAIPPAYGGARGAGRRARGSLRG